MASYDINQMTFEENTYNFADQTARNGLTTLTNALPSTMTGATSSTAGASGLAPAPAAGDQEKFLRGDGSWAEGGLPMVVLSYGNSTWNDFINAYNKNIVVYCRASTSASDPSTGSQTRLAFMAYVNDATSPTQVEFQYYRSIKTHNASEMTDQVYVYVLDQTKGWSVGIRRAGLNQLIAGDGISVSWSSNTATITNTVSYTNATISADGLMSSTDKTKLDAIDTSLYATKSDTVLNTTLSRGRAANTTLGTGSFAFGDNVTASADYAHAEGSTTNAGGAFSHAEGYYSSTSNYCSHAEGSVSTANGFASHAEGVGGTASGYGSHVDGCYTTANHKAQHVFGEYNISDASNADANNRGDYIEIVGNGTASNALSNARTLDWNGNEVLAGKLTLGTAPTANMDAATKQYVDSTIEAAIADLSYSPIQISAFSVSPASAETGSTVTSATLSYTMNKRPTSATLDGAAQTINQDSGTINLTGLFLTANKTWTLAATDGRGTSDSKTATLSFLNKAHWGVATQPAEINSSFVLGLANGVLTASRSRTISVNAGTSQYIWYAVPSALGTCSFAVGGFSGGFTKAATITHTNASGASASYDVYRSVNAALGETSVVVS